MTSLAANVSAQLIPDDLASLGLTPKSWTWNPGQRELAERIAQSSKKIIMLEAECGSGKSIIPTAAATALDKTAIVLTQTLSLQEQYLRDIQGLTLMSGRAHSECNLTFQSAADAPCTVGAKCTLKGHWTKTGQPLGIPTCNYFKRKAAAATAPISIQNYAYWLRETDGEQISAFGKRDWIICDEGHELDQILMNAAIVELKAYDFRELGTDLLDQLGDMTMTSLRAWALKAGRAAITRYKTTLDKEANRLGLPFDGEGEIVLSTELFASKGRTIQGLVRGLQVHQRVKQAIDTLGSLQDDALVDWVIAAPDRNNREWTVRPRYGKYGFPRILNGATEKVIIMSAYLAPELLMKNLGLDPNDVDVIVGSKVYNRVRSPILYCPTVRVNYKITNKQQQFLIATMDAILAKNSSTKGLIHVPSVRMRDDILAYTKFRNRIIAYDGGNVANPRYPTKDVAIAEFTSSPEPKILLGQSISTGLDLPDVPQWQIIMKLAFPSTADPVVASRKEVDPFFYDYHTICQIVQTTGRVKRSQAHNGQTIILDESFAFFWARNRKYFPRWFTDNFKYDGWAYLPDVKKLLPRIASSVGIVY